MADITAEYLEQMLLGYRCIRERGMSLYVARKRSPTQNISDLFALPDPVREENPDSTIIFRQGDWEMMIGIFGYSEFPEQFGPYIKQRKIFLFTTPEYRESLSVEAFQRILDGKSAAIQCDTDTILKLKEIEKEEEK